MLLKVAGQLDGGRILECFLSAPTGMFHVRVPPATRHEQPQAREQSVRSEGCRQRQPEQKEHSAGTWGIQLIQPHAGVHFHIPVYAA